MSGILIFLLDCLMMKNIQNSSIHILEKITVGNIMDKNMKKESAYYKYDLHIPVISGLENVKLQKQINGEINDQVDFFINELVNATKEFLSPNIPYFLNSSYTVNNVDNGILSFCIEFSNYLGGAHGMAYKICYNYDTNTGEKLELKDLFDNDDYVERINSEIEKQIKMRNEEFGYEVINNFTGISKDQNFYVKEGQLVIYFDLYEIAPYVAGIIEFVMPIDIY